MTFEEIISWHRARYPRMQAQDWAKLCYQSEMGAGHLIADPAACRQRLACEYDQTPASDLPLFEEIGGGLCRLYLGPLHGEGVRLETVARLFELAARPRGSLTGIEARLAQVETPANAADLQAYRKQGYQAVSHSRAYRQAYAPAYRLVPVWARDAWPVIRALDSLLARQGRVLAGIDGMSGSGKSTLAGRLQRLFGGNLFHMDDFFLPLEQKTPERLSQPGGNVDHERFRREVLVPLTADIPFSYRPFRCRDGTLGAPVRVASQPLSLVEGVYSLHPAMAGPYDCRAFLKLDPQTQSRRILARSGSELHRRFMTEWIPMENQYFAYYGVESTCGVVIDTEKWEGLE